MSEVDAPKQCLESLKQLDDLLRKPRHVIEEG